MFTSPWWKFPSYPWFLLSDSLLFNNDLRMSTVNQQINGIVLTLKPCLPWEAEPKDTQILVNDKKSSSLDRKWAHPLQEVRSFFLTIGAWWAGTDPLGCFETSAPLQGWVSVPLTEDRSVPGGFRLQVSVWFITKHWMFSVYTESVKHGVLFEQIHHLN